FTFFNNWKKSFQQKSFYEQSDLDFDSNLKTLTEIALEKVKELNITNPFFEIDFQKVIGDGNKINGILKNFLKFELKEKNKLFSYIFEPSYFEVSFGKNIGDKRFSDSTLSVDTSIVLENINIRGKVDRVDILKQNNKLLFIIFDYKTGKYLPGLKDITEGISLQLPIYILCIKKIFENTSHYEIIPAGGVYYSLNESPEIIPGIFNINYFNNTRSKKVMEESEYSSVLNKSVEFIKEYINDISSGKFGYPKPERDLDSICRFCNYVTICRIKTHKTIEYNN
ncbi:MAG TPA: PD-(D/E)XK nuclease family protein, partial [Bacteroidota bacterium]|nr:PD-(D/E)XK nuclease family protein [Bacteroidota bacterium]